MIVFSISILSKFEFMIINIFEKIFLSYNVGIHLEAKDLMQLLSKVIIESRQSEGCDFLCHHFDERLKIVYLTVKDSL